MPRTLALPRAAAGMLAAVATLSTLSLLSADPLHAATVPPGFVLETTIPSYWFTNPVQILFLPDGRRLVLEQRGVIRTVLPYGEVLAEPFLDLTDEVHSRRDLGLLGAALDPDFDRNRWIYLAYTVDPDGDGADDNEDLFARVTRYQMSAKNPDVADPTSRRVILGASWPEGIPVMGYSHSVGTLVFGADGTLLVGTGDGGHFEEVDRGGLDPDGFGPGRTDPTEDVGAFRARSLGSLSGAVLRVDKSTGLGLPSNPFWDGNPKSHRSRIWVYGLRNPFRFVLRPGTGNPDPEEGEPGTLYIADVGWNDYEELDIAPGGGMNFGWPCQEGPAPQPLYQSVTSTAAGDEDVLCGSPLNPENPLPATPPVLWWNQEDGALSHPAGWTGSAAIAGPFYTGDAYPKRYREGFFLADFIDDWIRFVRVNGKDEVVGWEDFVTEAGGPVHLTIDPATGYLNYVSIYTRQVKRVRFGAATSVDAGAGEPQGETALRSLFLTTGRNPFRDGTEVLLRATAAMNVTVEVHDSNGRLVRRLRAGEIGPGETRMTWDGRNEAGERVAPGIYHVMVAGEGMTLTRKLAKLD